MPGFVDHVEFLNNILVELEKERRRRIELEAMVPHLSHQKPPSSSEKNAVDPPAVDRGSPGEVMRNVWTGDQNGPIVQGNRHNHK